MQSKKKVLFIGDFKNANWHPATEIDQIISELLSATMVLTVEEDYASLTLEKLRDYDLLINYADQWGSRGSAQAAGAITAYAATGGAVLGLHNGIIAPLDHYQEIPLFFGARFTNHPPYTDLTYQAVATDKVHPIMAGFESFTMGEEPYMFEMNNFSRLEHLIEYCYEGKCYPAAWVVHFGLGRTVYLAPGHDVRSFRNPDFQKLLLRSALWATDQL